MQLTKGEGEGKMRRQVERVINFSNQKDCHYQMDEFICRHENREIKGIRHASIAEI